MAAVAATDPEIYVSLEISAGLYKLTLPDNWAHVPLESEGLAYFERTDRTMGVYVRALDFTFTEEAGQPEQIARHVQQVHATSFKQLKEVPWMAGPYETEASPRSFNLIHVRYDHESRYRVVSYVQINGTRGCHLTIHNYMCNEPTQSDLEASRLIATVHRPTEA